MATAQLFVFLFAILLPSTIILAQEAGSSAAVSFSSHPGAESTTAAAPSPAHGIFGHFNPSHIDFGAFMPDIFASGHFGFGGHHKRSVDASEIEEHLQREKRSVVKCNYATEGGFKCTSCKQARRCYPFNQATLTTCSGGTPYCRNGFCSATKGALCTATTSTTTDSSTDSSSDSTESSSDDSTSADSSSSSSGSSSSSSSDSSSASSSDSATSATSASESG